MNTHTTKTKENKTPIANQELIQKQNDVSPFQFMDNRPKAVTQRKIQELADNRNQVAQLKGLNKIIPNTAMNVTQLQSMEVIQLLKDSEVTATFGGNGISKANAIYHRNHRPQYAAGQVLTVWNNAKNGDGKVFDPNTGKELVWDGVQGRQGIWDMGHRQGHDYQTLWESLATSAINYATFLAEYQNPDNYYPEDPSANRGHAYE